MHMHRVSAASLESWVYCLWKGYFIKVQHRWHFPKVLPNQHSHTGVSGYTGEIFSCALVMCKPGQQPKASHSQDLNSSLSLQAASPCSKHLGQALPDFSDSGQKFKYYFKWIKKLRTKNIIPIKKKCCPMFYTGDRNNHCIKVSIICFQIQHMSVQDFRSQTLGTCRRKEYR